MSNNALSPSAFSRPNRPLYSPKSSRSNLHNNTTDSFNLLVVDETSLGRKDNGSNFGGPTLTKIPSYKNLADPCNTR